MKVENQSSVRSWRRDRIRKIFKEIWKNFRNEGIGG
jgi:hypothetical protein